MTPEQLLQIYDTQLRESAEMISALHVERIGPLWCATMTRGGFVSYRSLEGCDVDELIDDAVGYFRDRTQVPSFEWKTRGHDWPDDLPDRLLRKGFRPEPEETVMVGEVERLIVDVPIPPEVTVRPAETEDDIVRAATTQAQVFGGGPSAAETVQRLARAGGTEQVWLAEVGDTVVSASRLSLVPGTTCAGLWGGATLPQWRGQGIYRALTSARARAAAARGVRFMHSDCSPMSRPILERAGLVPVTTTTPYDWTR